MALPKTDTFTAADGTGINAYDVNWVYQNGVDPNIQINTNACTAGASGDLAVYWNGDVFGNDQYAKCVHVAVSAGTFRGIAVRCNTGANTRYGFHGSSGAGQIELFKVVAGVFTSLATGSGAVTINDTFELRVTGSGASVTLTPLQNGATPAGMTATFNPPNDGINSGQAGIVTGGSGLGARIDSWEGGNLGAGGSTAIAGFGKRMQSVIWSQG